MKKIFEIRTTKAKRLVTPWGFVLTHDRPIRVEPGDRLVGYAKSNPGRLSLREIDVAAEERRAEAEAKPKPIPSRRRKKPSAPSKEPPATPSSRPELIAQLGKDTRAVLKSRAEEFGLLVSTGATKAEIKADILAAFDARTAASSSGDTQPDPS